MVHFAFPTTTGAMLSTESVAGRFTVLGFLTTYDLASQGEARVLAALLRRHSPRINVAAIILEPPENVPLVSAFATTLGLTYPVAIADAETIAGRGPFVDLHHVPSIVILDPTGHEAFRYFGLASEDGLEQALKAVEAKSAAPAEMSIWARRGRRNEKCKTGN